MPLQKELSLLGLLTHGRGENMPMLEQAVYIVKAGSNAAAQAGNTDKILLPIFQSRLQLLQLSMCCHCCCSPRSESSAEL